MSLHNNYCNRPDTDSAADDSHENIDQCHRVHPVHRPFHHYCERVHLSEGPFPLFSSRTVSQSYTNYFSKCFQPKLSEVELQTFGLAKSFVLLRPKLYNNTHTHRLTAGLKFLFLLLLRRRQKLHNKLSSVRTCICSSSEHMHRRVGVG